MFCALCSVAVRYCAQIYRTTSSGRCCCSPVSYRAWRMGFARDKITARGRGPLARSARRAESSPPHPHSSRLLSPLPARLSAPTRTARPIARAPHKRNGPLGQTRSDIIAFAAPAPVHRTAGRRALHPGPGPRGVSVGGPRHPAASRTDTFMRPGAAPSWPFCFCACVLWRPRTFSGLSPVCPRRLSQCGGTNGRVQ